MFFKNVGLSFMSKGRFTCPNCHKKFDECSYKCDKCNSVFKFNEGAPETNLVPNVKDMKCKKQGRDSSHNRDDICARICPNCGAVLADSVFEFKYICPYCINGFDEYLYECQNPRCSGTKDVKGHHVFRKQDVGNDVGAQCDACHMNSTKKVCPEPDCHGWLPDSTFEGEDKIISIVGTRGSGKSHYIGVLIKEMMQNIIPEFPGASFMPFSDTLARYEANYGDRLYKSHQPMPQTPPGQMLEPYIFNYRFKGKKDMLYSYTFVIFDAAGEDLTDNTLNRYIEKSAGVIFLFDPMRIDGCKKKLSDDEVDAALGRRQTTDMKDSDMKDLSSTFKVLEHTEDLLKRNKKNVEEKKNGLKIVKIPMAITLPKYDAFEKILPEGLNDIREESPNVGKFDDENSKNVDAEIRTLLRDEWNAKDVINHIEGSFSNYRYFAVSVLDGSPKNKGGILRINEPKPHRIQDPLLWIMHEIGRLQE